MNAGFVVSVTEEGTSVSGEMDNGLNKGEGGGFLSNPSKEKLEFDRCCKLRRIGVGAGGGTEDEEDEEDVAGMGAGDVTGDIAGACVGFVSTAVEIIVLLR